MKTKIKCNSIEIGGGAISFLSDDIPVVTFDYDPKHPVTLTGLEIYLPVSIEISEIMKSRVGLESIAQSIDKLHYTPRDEDVVDPARVRYRAVWRDVIWATKMPDSLKPLTAQVYNYLLNARFPQDHWEAQKRHSGKGDSKVICKFAEALYQYYPPEAEPHPVFRCVQYILDQLDIMAMALADCFKSIVVRDSVNPSSYPITHKVSTNFTDPESRRVLERRWKNARDNILYVLGGVDYEPRVEEDS